MDFDKFLSAPLSHKTEAFPVPELSDWFPEGGAEWVVRGLTAAEMGRARAASTVGTDNAIAAIEALAGKGDKVESIRAMLGLSDKDVPEDVTRRIEMLLAGSVSPELGSGRRDVVVRLSEMYPNTFYQLTNAILSLTGQGPDLGKAPPSGKAPKSKG